MKSMESKSVDSILFYILGTVGIVDFFLGACLVETNFTLATVVLLVGLALILWANYEGGYIGANKK